MTVRKVFQLSCDFCTEVLEFENEEKGYPEGWCWLSISIRPGEQFDWCGRCDIREQTLNTDVVGVRELSEAVDEALKK